MDNIKVEVKGTTATITIDLSKRLGPSSTGKTMIVATTKGNVEIAPGIKMGLNIYTNR